MTKLLQSERESTIQKDILDFLTAQGFLVWRQSLGAITLDGGKARRRNPMKGFPDIAGIVLKTGRFFVVEVKSSKGTLSSTQRDWLLRLSDHGVITIVARSIEDVVRGLNGSHESLIHGWEKDANGCRSKKGFARNIGRGSRGRALSKGT